MKIEWDQNALRQLENEIGPNSVKEFDLEVARLRLRLNGQSLPKIQLEVRRSIPGLDEHGVTSVAAAIHDGTPIEGKM